MAQPAVSVGEDRTDLIGVPAFWPKPTTEPLFTWESWIGQFFLAVNLREHCNANILLSEPAEVFDDPPPVLNEKDNQKPISNKPTVLRETTLKSARQMKSTTKEGKKNQKSAQTYFFPKRIKGSYHDYSSPWFQKVRKDSYKATLTETMQLSISRLL